MHTQPSRNVFNWTIQTEDGHSVTYADRARHQVMLNEKGELAYVYGGVRRDDTTDFTLTAVQPCHTSATLSSLEPSKKQGRASGVQNGL